MNEKEERQRGFCGDNVDSKSYVSYGYWDIYVTEVIVSSGITSLYSTRNQCTNIQYLNFQKGFIILRFYKISF